MLEPVEKLWQRLVDVSASWLPGGAQPGLAAAILGATLSTLAFIILWRAVRYVFALFAMKVASLEGTRVRALTVQNQEILSAQQIIQLAASALRWLGRAVVLLAFYIYLQTVLGLFPATQRFALILFGYAESAVELVLWSILAYIPSLLILIVVFLVARFFVSIARVFFSGVATGQITLPGFYPDWGQPTFELARVIIVVFAAVIMFPYLPGHGSSAFQAIGVFLGVLVSLGSSGAVANVISGIVLTYMRPFKVGDRVKIADAVGDVVERTAFVTRIRTPKNVEVTIPNAMVMGNHIVNYSALARERGLILHETVTIGYDVAWRQVHDLLITAAIATEKIVQDPPPFVLQTNLDDFYVAYEINAYTRDAGAMLRTYSELRGNIQDKFNEAGVEIMSPHVSALRDGNAAALPEDYLPKDYNAPAFRFAPLDWIAKK